MKQGFMLLEVMIALAIIALVVITLLGTQSTSLKIYGSAKNLSTATTLTQYKMSQYELLLKGKSFGEIPEKESGAFDDLGFPSFKWEMTFKEDDEFTRFSDVIQTTLSKENNENVQQVMSFSGVNQELVIDALTKNIKRLELITSWDDGFDQGEITVFEHFISPEVQ